MPPKPADDLETFLKRQDPSTLVGVLVELANDHEVVQARLARLQLADRPDKLAAGFRKTLTAWRRSSKFFSYREAGEFGRTLEAWLDQVDRELLPRIPLPHWRCSNRSSRPTAPSSSVPTIPTAASATRCAPHVGIGCKPPPSARHPRASGQAGLCGWSATTSTALAKNCCAVRTCCSTRRRCAHWWRNSSPAWQAPLPPRQAAMVRRTRCSRFPRPCRCWPKPCMTRTSRCAPC
jgi:hypothetical protein